MRINGKKQVLLPNCDFKFNIIAFRTEDETGAPLTETFEKLEGGRVIGSAVIPCCYITLREPRSGNEYIWCVPYGEKTAFFDHDPEEIAVQYFNDRFGTSFVDGRSWMEMTRLVMEDGLDVKGWAWTREMVSLFRSSDPRLDVYEKCVISNGETEVILREQNNIRY